MSAVRAWSVAGVCLSALLSMVLVLAACRERKPVMYKHHWNCSEHEQGCYCSDTGWTSAIPLTLCQKKYECCIWKSNALSGPEPTCECWNPSQVGPSCESQLPKGGDSFFLNRVEKCE